MKRLRIHYFEHVPWEGLGSIEEWTVSKGHSVTVTRFHECYGLPQLADIDWLIIMGGPMNVNDEEQYRWLPDEKNFIMRAIKAGKKVLGICLGSQLISSVLGARVYKNTEKEIGWFDIELSKDAIEGKFFRDMGTHPKVFHCHGDTFDLPENAVQLASSAITKNQAYSYKDHVLALQFHPEQTDDSLADMIRRGGIVSGEGRYIQSEKEILDNRHLIETNKTLLFTLLDRLAD